MTDVCGAKTRSGSPCQQVAGWGTDQVGTGRCKLHGGASTGRPIIHGRYSFKHAASLQGKVQEYLADPEPGNLLHELALMRALLQDFLDKMTDGAVDARSRGYAFEMAE